MLRRQITRCCICLSALILLLCRAPGAGTDPGRNELEKNYYSVLATYVCYAQSLWHDAAPGGYWGDGIDAKNKNGAVRGTANTLYAYAVVVKGLDENLLNHRDRKLLHRAGLSRDRLVDYIRQNTMYLVAHHKSATAGISPQWGYDWQSPLWMGALGAGTLVVWKDLGPELKEGLQRTAAAEADWVASRPPKNGSRGDTGAEENAWNTNAPAVALAMYPEATSATLWWHTLKSYAANVYSRPSDFAAAKKGGAGPVGDVTTTNILEDFSLLNHGFFHPDYVQVSGQHLGESWMILRLGDALHGTHLAQDFRHGHSLTWARCGSRSCVRCFCPRGSLPFLPVMTGPITVRRTRRTLLLFRCF